MTLADDWDNAQFKELIKRGEELYRKNNRFTNHNLKLVNVLTKLILLLNIKNDTFHYSFLPLAGRYIINIVELIDFFLANPSTRRDNVNLINYDINLIKKENYHDLFRSFKQFMVEKLKGVEEELLKKIDEERSRNDIAAEAKALLRTFLGQINNFRKIINK